MPKITLELLNRTLGIKPFEDKQLRPRLDAQGTPFCSEDQCPLYDGKRCEAMGFRPARICEPAVRAIVQIVQDRE